MKKIILSITTLIYAGIGIAQCELTISTPSTTVDCGGCFTLTADGDENAPLLSEDFNSSSYGPGWSSNVSVMYTNPCGSPPDGSAAAWFGQTSFPRQLQTIGFNVACGGEICFEMKYATQGGSGDCEGPDLTGEGVEIMYSTDNGASFTRIQYWDPNGGTDPYLTQWDQYCVTIPPAAQTNNTIFRWYQNTASGNGNDHWGIDNVEITRIPCGPYYYDWFVDGTPNSADTSLCLTGASQTYDVIYTDGISDTCSASITINEDFNLTVDLGPDSILNCNQNTIDLAANEGGGSGTYNYLWNDGSTGINSQNNLPAGQYWVEIADAAAPQCNIRDTVTITDPVEPIADFNFTPVCEEDGIVFTDNSTSGDGTLNSYEWDINSDGTINSTDFPTFNYVFNDDGTYDVVYIISDNKDCVDSITYSVEIYPNPEIDFTAHPLCLGVSTDFTNLTSLPSGANVTSWNWDFDELGTTSTIENPSHLFQSLGDYDIYLEVETDDGCLKDTTITITIDPNLTADLGIDSILNCNQNTIDLSANETGGSGSYNYTWSNGVTGVGTQNGLPSGQYWVEVSDANAPQCLARDTVTITDPVEPIADFNFTPVCEEDGIVFTDNSTSGDGTLNSYEWDINSDGTINSTDFPTFNYVFNDDGTYDVVYIISDNKDCVDSIVQSVEIYPNPEIDFTAHPLCLGAVTNFTNLTTLPTGTNVTTWAWDFDAAGATSSIESPSYLYQNIGNYDVSLEVTTEDGCTKDTIIQIYVAPSTDASFTFSTACDGEIVDFTNTSNGNYENSQWVFMSDSDTLYATDTSFTFPSYGDYDVTLIIEDAIGVCSDTINQTITVHPLPDLSFTADPMIGTPVMNVNFFSDPSGLISNSWDFANGNSSTELNDTVSSSYSVVGTYDVVHSGFSYEGCFNSYTSQIFVDYNDVSYEIPNIITPNNDGINDGFYINFMEAAETIDEFEIIFLNRWGNVINSFNDPLFIWDGTNNSNNKVSDGVYFYKMKFSTIKGKTHNEHGFVQVVND